MVSKLYESAAKQKTTDIFNWHCFYTVHVRMSKKFLCEETSYPWSKAFIFIQNTSWLKRADQARLQEAVALGTGGGFKQRSR